MKYALIIALALIILRIDMFVGVAERAWNKVPRPKVDEAEISEEALPVSTFSVGDVETDKLSPLRLLITEFSYNPDRATREMLVEYIRSNPELLNLNPEILFSEMEKWRPYVAGENPELALLLNDLLNIFSGERKKVIQQFYSKYLDENPEFFFHYYPIQGDVNCIVAKYDWNSENVLNKEGISQRMKRIGDLAGQISPTKFEFSKNCQLVLRVEASKN
ncbi:MAG TPA: hypothetical protein VKZ84_03105 [Bacteriovoracaceae bacterium]|nr:hypothetical protein [Bacteriovoracaceae bacterium]